MGQECDQISGPRKVDSGPKVINRAPDEGGDAIRPGEVVGNQLVPVQGRNFGRDPKRDW